MTTFKIAVQIGAALTGGFTSAIKGSTAQLGQLGASIDTLKRKQAAIKKVELGEASVGKARVAYNAAVGDLVRLRREMSKTEEPSRQLAQAYERAQQKATRLSTSLGQQRERLQQARQALKRTGLSTDNLSNDNRKLGQSVERLNRQYTKLGQSIRAQDRLKAQRAELRGQLFDAVALGATVAAPIKVAVEFEQSIAKLGAITASSDLSDEVNEQNRQALENEAKRLGRETQFTASQTADAMTFLGMAGFNPDEIHGATEGVLNLAKAAGTDLAQTADIASNILSGFSLDATQDMARVGDVLTATFTSSNTTLSSLGETMKFVAPIASNAGGSIEQVAAMVGLLGDVGIQGSRAGTALRATFLRLSAPTGAAKKALASLGIEVADIDGNLRSVPDLLKDISFATNELGSVQRTSLIKTIFGEEAASGVSELLKQAGLSELDALIAKAAQGGQGAAELKATFAQLEAPFASVSTQLAQLGVQAVDTQGNLRPVPELIQSLAKATSSLDSTARNDAVKKLFAADQATLITPLLDQASTNTLDAELAKLAKANGTADRIAKKMSATTLGSLQRLGSALESVAISVGSLLLPTIATLAEGFAGLASGVAGFAEHFPLLTTVVMGSTVGLIGLRIATIAGGFAYTFLKGAVLSLRTAYLALTTGMVLQKGAMFTLNVLGKTTTAVMGVMTAAQWAWNVAMTANPIGLMVVSIGALVGAGVMLVKHWDKVSTFFTGLWSGIKTVTSLAIDWLLGKLDLLLSPFTLLSKIGKGVGGAIGRLFDDDMSDNPNTENTQGRQARRRSSVGKVINQSTVSPDQLSNLQRVESTTLQQTHQGQLQNTVRIDAPITINAEPGMDANQIAQAVRRELDQREAQADARRRSQLFDEAIT